jgi:hypothetical protein
VAGYAVMSNHLQVVLRMQVEREPTRTNKDRH